LAALLSGVVFLFILTAPTPLKADEWDLATVFSVNQPVEIPGKVLEPNTKYLIKLLDSPSNRSVVQVFDEHRQHLYTTFFGIPKYRPEATDHTTFEFMEVPAGNPMPIRAWYYPGRIKGLEFMYSKKQLDKIAGYADKTTSASLIETASAAPVAPPVKTESESAVVQQNEVVTQQALNEQPAEIAQNEPQVERSNSDLEVQKSEQSQSDIERSKPTEPEQSATPPAERSPSQLPKTADVMALFGLAGALSLGLGVGVRAWRK
jgi:hypothetical protein